MNRQWQWRILAVCLAIVWTFMVWTAAWAVSRAQVGEKAGEIPNQVGEDGAITIRATKYEFDIREIRVKQGETVTIALKAENGYHTLKIEGYGVEVRPNRTVSFVAYQKGEFPYRCSVVCGTGHNDMTGKLIVE